MPINLLFSQVVKIGGQPVSFQIGPRYYVTTVDQDQMGRSIHRNLALSSQIDVRSRSRVMSVLLEMIGRGWENFLARPNGSMSLRFYVQPTMASSLALRAGIQDAREGRQGYRGRY